jgi:hypothetical protein
MKGGPYKNRKELKGPPPKLKRTEAAPSNEKKGRPPTNEKKSKGHCKQ